MTLVFMVPAVAFTACALMGYAMAIVEDVRYGETAQAGILMACSTMVGLGAVACWTVTLT